MITLLKRYHKWRRKNFPASKNDKEFLQGGGFPPILKYGFAANLCLDGDEISCDYLSTHNAGLFANCTTALEDVLNLQRAGITAGKITFSQGMRLFKDDIEKDVYPVFFERMGNPIVSDDVLFEAFDVHKPYKDLPLQALNNTVESLFKPSRRIFELASEWVEKANFNPKSTIAIYYRGTDKGKEIQLAPIEDYIAVIEKIDKTSKTAFDILVQTDQAQARQAIIERFGARVRYFDSLPVTTGTKGIHKIKFGKDVIRTRETFAIQMIAAVVVMSQCAYVVATTCNVGAWIAFYRGNARNFYQFDENGKLVTPYPPDAAEPDLGL